MNDRERATTLAALRFWQSDGSDPNGEVLDIATNHGEFGLLDSDEIDQLYERLNTGDGDDGERARVRELARSQYARDGELEIDDNAEVSYAHNHERGEPCHNADPDGAYVAAWVWIDLTDDDSAADDPLLQPAVCARCGNEGHGIEDCTA